MLSIHRANLLHLYFLKNINLRESILLRTCVGAWPKHLCHKMDWAREMSQWRSKIRDPLTLLNLSKLEKHLWNRQYRSLTLGIHSSWSRQIRECYTSPRFVRVGLIVFVNTSTINETKFIFSELGGDDD